LIKLTSIVVDSSIVRRRIEGSLAAFSDFLELLAERPETIYPRWPGLVRQRDAVLGQVVTLVREEQRAAWSQLTEWRQLCEGVPAVAVDEHEALTWHRRLLEATEMCVMHDL
jgi:hypothetical protein